MTAAAFEERSGLDSHRLPMDVAFDPAGGRQMYLVGADVALHAAADGDVLAQDVAVDERLLADDKAGAMDVASDLSVDLHMAIGGERSVHHEVAGDDGRRRVSTRTLHRRCGRCSSFRLDSRFRSLFIPKHDKSPPP